MPASPDERICIVRMLKRVTQLRAKYQITKCDKMYLAVSISKKRTRTQMDNNEPVMYDTPCVALLPPGIRCCSSRRVLHGVAGSSRPTPIRVTPHAVHAGGATSRWASTR